MSQASVQDAASLQICQHASGKLINGRPWSPTQISLQNADPARLDKPQTISSVGQQERVGGTGTAVQVTLQGKVHRQHCCFEFDDSTYSINFKLY
jgi:hypothetical protein